jgi:hypothetical protein
MVAMVAMVVVVVAVVWKRGVRLDKCPDAMSLAIFASLYTACRSDLASP